MREPHWSGRLQGSWGLQMGLGFHSSSGFQAHPAVGLDPEENSGLWHPSPLGSATFSELSIRGQTASWTPAPQYQAQSFAPVALCLSVSLHLQRLPSLSLRTVRETSCGENKEG